MEEIRHDIKEIKNLVLDLVKQSAIHNVVLAEHEKRSTQLEERFKPIEQSWVFVSKAAAVVMTGGALATAMVAMKEAVQYLLR